MGKEKIPIIFLEIRRRVDKNLNLRYIAYIPVWRNGSADACRQNLQLSRVIEIEKRGELRET